MVDTADTVNDITAPLDPVRTCVDCWALVKLMITIVYQTLILIMHQGSR